MASEKREIAAYHESSHAVTARKLGIEALFVTITQSDPRTEIVPASDRAKKASRPVRPQDYEHDAINALAGLAANRRSHPSAVPVWLPNHYPDIAEARAAVLRMIFLRTGRPLPEGKANVKLDAATTREFRAEYDRMDNEAAALVERHWLVIQRVANHLVRHGRISDQATLDDLIERAERYVLD
jgi:hypothetical protein